MFSPLYTEQIEARGSLHPFEHGKNQPRVASRAAEHQMRGATERGQECANILHGRIPAKESNHQSPINRIGSTRGDVREIAELAYRVD